MGKEEKYEETPVSCPGMTHIFTTKENPTQGHLKFQTGNSQSGL